VNPRVSSERLGLLSGPVGVSASQVPAGVATLPSSAPPAISDHTLIRRIGAGSYGEVWLARNVLGEPRAVKVIYRDRFADPRPFEREFEGIQRFEPISRSHPSQLAILHVGKNDEAGLFYYVMELADSAPEESPKAEGRSPKEIRKPQTEPALSSTSGLQPLESYFPHTLRFDLEQRGRLPVRDCVQIGLSLTTALAHLHEQGLVHRDIKPSNVVFVKSVAKLGDIGLVAEAGDTQSIVGTEGYLPPEGPGTPQADIFSLGKVLYEISTGMDRRRFPELPEDLRDWQDRKQVVEFNEILLKACAKDSAQRYQTAEALGKDLDLLDSGKSVRGKRRLDRASKVAKQWAFSLIVLGIFTVGILSLLNIRHPSGAKDSVLGGSTNQTAVDRYVRANADLFNTKDIERLKSAVKHFQEAIDSDTNYALAYVGMAAACRQLDILYEPRKGWHQKAFKAAERAISLNTNLAEAYAVRGDLFFTPLQRWDATNDFSDQRHALRLNKQVKHSHFYLAFLYHHLGLQDEALTELNEEQRIDRADQSPLWLKSYVLVSQGNYSNAVTLLDSAPAEAFPHPRLEGYVKALALFYGNKTNEAAELLDGFLRRDDLADDALLVSAQAMIAAARGNRTQATEKIKLARQCDEQLAHFHHVAYSIGSTYSLLGSNVAAIYWLKNAANEGYSFYPFLNIDPTLKNLYGDTNFKAFLEDQGRQYYFYRKTFFGH
jgi:serine/threonine protein kinase